MDLNWKSYIFNLKKGTLKFILNATIDTLPTNANLKQWGKSPSDKCPLPGCGVRQTTGHLLSSCRVSLNQGRYTFRHDGIVQYIVQCMDKSRFEVYADLEGHKTPDGRTIPASVCLTAPCHGLRGGRQGGGDKGQLRQAESPPQVLPEEDQVQAVPAEHLGAGSKCQLLPVDLPEGPGLERPSSSHHTFLHTPVTQ